jgi:hypothetical protein
MVSAIGHGQSSFSDFKEILPVDKSCFFSTIYRCKNRYLLFTSESQRFAMLVFPRKEFGYEAPPSQFMRLGSGISNLAKSPIVSCFDVELYADEDLSDRDGMSETELFALFGCHGPNSECSV